MCIYIYIYIYIYVYTCIYIPVIHMKDEIVVSAGSPDRAKLTADGQNPSCIRPISL